jgi:hypothetical protein
LGAAAAKGRGVEARQGGQARPRRDHRARTPGEIGFSVLRGGGIVGEHSVTFAAEDEILTLAHSARDRSLFARGAVACGRLGRGQAARRLRHARRPGIQPRLKGGFTMPQSLKLDATEQLAAVAARRISALELLEVSLSRQQQVHGRLNAVVATSLERAMEHARALDERRAKGEAWGRWPGFR